MDHSSDVVSGSVATAEVLEYLIEKSGDRMPGRVRIDFEKLIRKARAKSGKPTRNGYRADTEG